jgi:hypothetical protein
MKDFWLKKKGFYTKLTESIEDSFVFNGIFSEYEHQNLNVYLRSNRGKPY